MQKGQGEKSCAIQVVVKKMTVMVDQWQKF